MQTWVNLEARQNSGGYSRRTNATVCRLYVDWPDGRDVFMSETATAICKMLSSWQPIDHFHTSDRHLPAARVKELFTPAANFCSKFCTSTENVSVSWDSEVVRRYLSPFAKLPLRQLDLYADFCQYYFLLAQPEALVLRGIRSGPSGVVLWWPWTLAGFFPGVGNESVWMTEVPSGVQGRAPVGGKAPRSWRHFLKIMHKYFVYWDFKQHCSTRNTLQHFHGDGKCPPRLAHACGRPWIWWLRYQTSKRSPLRLPTFILSRNDSEQLVVVTKQFDTG